MCNRRCIQDNRIGGILKCKGCTDIARGKDLAPMTVLYCVRSEHNEEKPDSPTLFKELKKYLKGMPKIDEKSLCFANFGYIALSSTSSSSKSKTKAPIPNHKIPFVNSQTGEVSNGGLPNEDRLSSSPEVQDSCFLMQTLKIGNSNCLVMFDRGSNINLINGSLAEDEDLFVLSQSPSTLKVAGGGVKSPLSMVSMTEFRVRETRLALIRGLS